MSVARPGTTFATVRRDVLAALAVAVLFGATYYAVGVRFPSDGMLIDFWFQSDTPRVYNNMTSRFYVEGDQFSSHYRAKVHPLFPLMGWGGPFLLRLAFGLPLHASVVAFSALVGGVLVGTFFMLLRLIGLRIPDAGVFTLLMGTNAAAIAWLTVPETFPLGALSIVAALVFVAVIQHRTLHPAWTVAISVFTFAATITNWMAGLVATFLRHAPFDRRLLHLRPAALVRILWPAIAVTGASAAVITALWVAQRLLFPTAPPFVYWGEEFNYVLMDESGGIAGVLRSFLFHTVIFPAYHLGDVGRDYLILLTQSSPVGSATPWGKVAALAWAALLVLGTIAAVGDRENARFRFALGSLIAGQLALHLVYGGETFLYAIHFMPLLVCVAAYGARSRFRVAVLLLAVLFTITAGLNNVQQYEILRDYVLRHGLA